jgi:hypothetical protein
MNANDYQTLIDEVESKGYEHPDIVAKMNRMSEEEMDIYMMLELGCSDTDEARRILDLYYDSYEYRNGDGYYPGDKQEDGFNARQAHVFQKDKNSWIQLTGPVIQGLDGHYGVRLLEKLNASKNKENQMTAKLCLNRIKNTTDVVKVNANDLTPAEFACKVVDEMRSCAWAAQADEILSYIGEHNCTHIISRDGTVLFPKKRL